MYMSLRKLVGKYWLENRGNLLHGFASTNLPANSTVKIELMLDNGNRVTGTGVIVDANSILTAAHVLAPVLDGLVDSIRISTNTNQYSITDFESDSFRADIVGDPDPDRNGEGQYSLIGKDLGVLGSMELSFSENSFANLDIGSSHAVVTQPGYGNISGANTLEVSRGLAFARRDDLYETTHKIFQGDSGSGLFTLTKNGYQVVGIVSTDTFSARLTNDSIELIGEFARANDVSETALVDQGQSPSNSIMKDGTKLSDLNNLVLIDPLDKITDGLDGFDKAIIKDSISQIALDSASGDATIYWQDGNSSRLLNFEVIITPNSTIYTSNDKMYGLVHKGIQVLMGFSAADEYAGRARAWFEHETDDLSVVNRLLVESGYSGSCQTNSKQLATSITENLQLSSKLTAAELSNVEEWADLHSHAELVLAGINYIEQTNEILG